MAAMHTLSHPKLQVFKPGRHTAMSGAALAFSEADLQACASAYDPALHEAPIVVGHPKTDAPAYGWVRSLAFADGALEAQPDQVDAAFAELVTAGRFKKISSSFYSPDAPGNPVPGVYYLRHVGFLGAQPPAVKGLRAPAFADGEEGVIEFADWSDVQNASLWRRLRDFLISQFGLEKADRVIPDYSVADLEAEARRETADEVASTPLPSYADPDPQPLTQETSTVSPEQAAALQAENAQLKAQVDAATAQQKAARIAAVHADNTAFAEALIRAGKLLPVEQAVAVATLDHFAQQETVLEFSEGGVQKPLADGFKALLQALPKRVEFAEIAGGASGDAPTVDFAAPAGYTVDGDALEVHAKAIAYQAANAGTDYITAVKAVS